VEVFGRRIEPGQLIHADKHGFLAVTDEEQAGLLDAARFMDSNECQTVIPAGRGAAGKDTDTVLTEMFQAARAFGDNVRERFGAKGEW
jgi:regulator of RNase E activity RraA